MLRYKEQLRSHKPNGVSQPLSSVPYLGIFLSGNTLTLKETRTVDELLLERDDLLRENQNLRQENQELASLLKEFEKGLESAAGLVRDHAVKLTVSDTNWPVLLFY